MIGTNQPSKYIQLYDLYEDDSYDIDNVDTLIFTYKSVLHHNVTIKGLILV